MSTSTKRRARKTTQENVIDIVPNGNGDAPLPEKPQTVKAKGRATKRPAGDTVPVENGGQEEAVLTKRGRGRTKVNPAEPVSDEEVAKKVVKKTEKKKTTSNPAVRPSSRQSVPKEIEPKNEPKDDKKSSRGRRKPAADVVEAEPEVKKAAPRRGLKTIPEAVQTNGTADADHEENPGPSKSRGARGKKVAAEKEETKDEEQAIGRAKPRGKKPLKEKEEPKAKETAKGKTKPVEKEEFKEKELPKRQRGAKAKSEEPVEISVPPKKRKPAAAKEPKEKGDKKLNATDTKYESLDFSTDKEHTLKISSWNVAGLRAWIKKGGLDYINHEKPDILCLQETKCIPDDVPEEAKLSGYHPYWLCKPGGHAGVAIYSKIMPIHIEYGLGDDEQDEDGRILTAEYEKFYLVNVYVPNAGRKLVTLPKRLRWNKLFEKHLEKLNAKKPVVICGDMNVAHNEIDLANPKTNKKNAGFTQEERDGMSDLLAKGFVDTYRHFYPDQERAYTFWAYFMNSRAKDVGWRLDYFIVAERLLGKCVDNIIRSKVLGSDHCPITLLLNL